ncbi:MAG: hypothetical protein WBP38_12825 [Hyphomicrobium sp.]
MDVAPIEFQVRLVEDAVWKRVYATTPEQAAAAFVAEREADGGWQLAVNRRAALVVVAASTEAYVEACYRVTGQMRPYYEAAVVLPGQRALRSA